MISNYEILESLKSDSDVLYRVSSPLPTTVVILSDDFNERRKEEKGITDGIFYFNNERS